MSQRVKKIIWWTTGVLLFIGFSFWLIPVPKSYRTYSTALFDESGNLLAASMTPDEQWCFPSQASLPEKYKQALILYEDERFYYHPGVDLYALGRAFFVNLKSGNIKQGGSTISMQVSRLLNARTKRNIWVKAKEAILAVRLEVYYSKEEMLSLYAHHAPFGSNIIGIEAACNRYFGVSPAHISWAQASLLAVLPNNPALLFPGRNKDKLIIKRNKLLARLFEKKLLDESTYQLAIAEPIPEKILPLPSITNHLLTRTINDGRLGKQFNVTLDPILQQRATLILKRHGHYLRGNQIMNGAALILDSETGRCLAYVGNMPGRTNEDGSAIDMIKAKRSYGSLLKPFLYAAMLDEGMLLPQALVEDIPTNFDGYSPNNYFKEFEGVVKANEVLSRSLNVPSVRMLHTYGVQKFIQRLNKLGISSINKPASYYGLSLILGGGEATLWELCGAYMNMMRASQNKLVSINPYYILADSTVSEHVYSPLVSSYTLLAITENKRVGAEGDVIEFSNDQTVAWKTGTSFGARDGWSIGVNGKYVIGVWIGNADGEGRNGLTGIGMASPVMFDLFSILPKQTWPQMPYANKNIKVCAVSGWKSTPYCSAVKEISDPGHTGYAPACSFHKPVSLDSTGRYRVNSQCYASFSMKQDTLFVLPPVQETYYKRKHAEFKTLPAYLPTCNGGNNEKNIGLIYPRQGITVYIPRELSGKKSRTVLEATHRTNGSMLFWHLNNEYIGSTTNVHQIEIMPAPGSYLLTVMDESGESIVCNFKVAEK